MSNKITQVQLDNTTYNIEPTVTSTLQVDNAAPTLAWNTTSVVGTVDGVDLTVKMPVNPVTVDTTLNSTSTNPVQNKAINTALSEKAPTSHASSATTYGVSTASNYGHAKASSTTPKANGTAGVGSETNSFARGDHVHPIDTTRAAATDLTNHTGNTTAHITAAERTNWNKAKTHADSAHNYIPTSQQGTAGGVAELDENGRVSSSQLPSYVDDVIEGTYESSTSFKNSSGSAITGESGKIYVDTNTNKTYRWSGSVFTEISASLAIGKTSSTAAAGDHTHPTATSSTDGLMSKTDKAKLDGVPLLNTTNTWTQQQTFDVKVYSTNGYEAGTLTDSTVYKARQIVHYDGIVAKVNTLDLPQTDGTLATQEWTKSQSYISYSQSLVWSEDLITNQTNLSGAVINFDTSKYHPADWNHAVITLFESSGGYKLYIDGPPNIAFNKGDEKIQDIYYYASAADGGGRWVVDSLTLPDDFGYITNFNAGNSQYSIDTLNIITVSISSPTSYNRKTLLVGDTSYEVPKTSGTLTSVSIVTWGEDD